MTQRQRARQAGERAPLRRVRAARRRRQRRRTLLTIFASALVVLIALGAWALFGRGRMDLSRYPMTYAPEIRAAAAEFSLDPAYVASVVLAESSFDAEAVSSAGAIGLMQIMPATGEWIAGKLEDEPFDVQRLYQPEVNLRYGCWYLRFLLDRYDEDMYTASTAYHQGQGRVDQWLEDPQYSEDGRTLTAISSAVTDTYVNRIMESYAHYQELY